MSNRISLQDNILEGITFDELITTIQCNEAEVTTETIKKVFDEILNNRLEDARYTLAENIKFIKENI